MIEDDDQNLLKDNQENNNPKLSSVLYAWGRNEDGQLSIPSSKQLQTPAIVKGFKGIVRDIATARTHTGIANRQGQLYMSGNLLFGKIGIPSLANNFRQFKLHTEIQNHKVLKVACGIFHTLAITEEGRLFTWGGTLWDKTANPLNTINKSQDVYNVIDVACGQCHSVVINAQGQIYSWGGGGKDKNKGQLGHGNKKDISKPTKIVFFNDKKVKKIACGDYHTMVVTKDQQLYAFGQGNYGQLGTGIKEDSSIPKKVIMRLKTKQQEHFSSGLNQNSGISQLALGGRHSLILTSKGHLYVCGFASQGQLGLGYSTENQFEPVLVQGLIKKNIIMIAAGGHHSMCLTNKNDIFVCGSNLKGQLGVGEEKYLKTWTHLTALQGSKTIKIFAGGDHSWAVLDEYKPLIENYRPPSPIKVNVPSAFDYEKQKNERNMSNERIDRNLSNERNQMKKKSSITSYNSNQMEIKQNISQNVYIDTNTNKKLQLFITTTQLSHRFIHFVFKDHHVKTYKAQIDAYIQGVKKIQGKKFKMVKLNQDGDIYDRQGRVSIPANPKGMTIMMICEMSEGADEHQRYKHLANKIQIGDLILLEANMLKKGDKVPRHNQWLFLFTTMFEKELQKARFVELRPQTK